MNGRGGGGSRSTRCTPMRDALWHPMQSASLHSSARLSITVQFNAFGKSGAGASPSRYAAAGGMP
jgi:hypothetical protein